VWGSVDLDSSLVLESVDGLLLVVQRNGPLVLRSRHDILPRGILQNAYPVLTRVSKFRNGVDTEVGLECFSLGLTLCRRLESTIERELLFLRGPNI
jgi:hypothetical protein